MTRISPLDLQALAQQIKDWGQALGFQQIAIADVHLGEHEAHLQRWLAAGFQGEMDYMARHGHKRSRPAELQPGTVRVITARMDYLPPDTAIVDVLQDASKAFISRYTLGRDYHKLIRKRLTQLGRQIEEQIGPFGYRAFVDSAPVLEKALAEKSGLGWIGKHTLLLDRSAGSWFFLGEIFVDIPLPVDPPVRGHCGTCNACMEVCPTQAIVAPYQLDARKCISYLTIELHGPIPEPLRAPMGNRVFGCDDCQLVCPWNRFARYTQEADFLPRHQLQDRSLVELFLWDEATYLQKTEGSAIRRIGYPRWLRNLAVGLGNAPSSEAVIKALWSRAQHPSELVREHVHWALARHGQVPESAAPDPNDQG
ncbi:MAG: tRNA epoxyqueuosine(34) reductase QueG [Ketobacter sp.]|nr:tRNA epoxyqueuosine(34) reductase QueG [Ketobacter sp.]RLT92168.1 MAG: tRNA epoxyqueuosine(34) reductase QueG [Ketobacter sp.]